MLQPPPHTHTMLPESDSRVDLTPHDNRGDNEFAALQKQAPERRSDTSALTLSCSGKSKSIRSRYAEEYSGETATESG